MNLSPHPPIETRRKYRRALNDRRACHAEKRKKKPAGGKKTERRKKLSEKRRRACSILRENKNTKGARSVLGDNPNSAKDEGSVLCGNEKSENAERSMMGLRPLAAMKIPHKRIVNERTQQVIENTKAGPNEGLFSEEVNLTSDNYGVLSAAVGGRN
jgi:hypothetical protein